MFRCQWKVFTSDIALCESWLKHTYSEHDWNNLARLFQSWWDRANTSKMADRCGEEASAQKNQNWSRYEAKCLVEIWADEETQRQLSVIGREQNIWENIAAKLGKVWKIYASTTKRHKLYNRAWNLKPTSDVNNAVINMLSWSILSWNMFL